MNDRITIGFSPCPNDCFMFDAMVHGKIDTEGIEFTPRIADIEELNRMAFSAELDATKVSFHAFAYLTDRYLLLDSGSALGIGCGPLLIARSAVSLEKVKGMKIAIPGKYTTANLLFSLAFPEATNKNELLFSEIENSVLSRKTDLGVIIHENRFTYQEKGLVKILDLGDYWEKSTHSPIPLGGIVVKKELDNEVKMKIVRILKKSIAYAFSNPTESLDFIKKNAQELDEQVIASHIKLYVNEFSLSLGQEGKKAINLLINKMKDLGLIAVESQSEIQPIL